MPSIERLPLFPLGIVLFPGERLPLHIFEDRYRAMTAWCLAESHPFGVVFFDQGSIASVGCTARIARVVESYEDGRMDILVDGEDRFEIRRLFHDLEYLTGDVDHMEEPAEQLDHAARERMITQHMRLLEIAGRPVRPSLYETTANLSYRIAPHAGLAPAEKQAVLELASENERIDYLVRHLEALIPTAEAKDAMRRIVQSNGHLTNGSPG